MVRYFLAVLVLSIAVASPLRADDDAPKPRKSKKKDGPVVAHIRLSGDLSEEPAGGEGLFGAQAENLQAKLDRIAKAKKDEKVKALYLEIGNINVGWGKVDELRRAIGEVRAAGKKVYAHLDSATTKEYLVASACDVVAIPESGEVMIPGLRAEVTFYKELFEKLKIQADFLQMGDFKGAAEPYTRSSMSAEFRKQFETFMDDVFEKSVVETIAQSRKAQNWSTADVKKLIDQAGFVARKAKEVGLVDRLAYADAFEEEIKKELAVEGLELARDFGKDKPQEIDFSNPFAIFKLLSPPKEPAASKKPKIAVIYAVGEIVTGRGSVDLMGGSSVGSTTIIEAIREAEANDSVKAIVLRVDSPGGSALASDLMWNELRRCKKPVVASMGDVAASGGYYISMACPKIFAEPGTLTGSIGVVGGKLVTGKTMEMVGLTTDVISRGANSGLESGQKPWSESERQVMKEMMAEVYDQFLTKTLEGRKRAGIDMSMDKLKTLAGGRIWTGRQAKEAGLVDELGTLGDAIAAVKKMANRDGEEMEILQLPKGRSVIEKYLDGNSDARLPVALLSGIPELAQPLRSAEAFWKLRKERVWLVTPFHLQLK